MSNNLSLSKGDPPNAEQQQQQDRLEDDEEKDFWTVWQEFKTAFKDIYKPFDEWYWIYTLLQASIRHVIRHVPLDIIYGAHTIKGLAMSFLPAAAISILLFLTWSYFTWIRNPILLARQQSCSYYSIIDDHTHTHTHAGLSIHDFLVLYFIIQILFHYTCVVYTSPGVVVDDSTAAAAVLSKDHKDIMISCNSTLGQGGCCGIHLFLSTKLELGKVQMSMPTSSSSKNILDKTVGPTPPSDSCYFPSPEPSFCNKCNKIRPPRAHHCSTCNRCILQMDHHCGWVNNCIGYSNYRSFFLTVAFLTLGCWYGMFLCAKPVYELWKHEYTNRMDTIMDVRTRFHHLSQFLEIPYGSFKIILVDRNKVEPQMILKIVFYILFGFSFFLTPLFYTHVHLICSAQTTLERLIELDQQKRTLLFTMKRWKPAPRNINTVQTLSITEKKVNPFDQGWKQNVKQILGEPLFWIWIPIRVDPPKPFVPWMNDKKTN